MILSFQWVINYSSVIVVNRKTKQMNEWNKVREGCFWMPILNRWKMCLAFDEKKKPFNVPNFMTQGFGVLDVHKCFVNCLTSGLLKNCFFFSKTNCELKKCEFKSNFPAKEDQCFNFDKLIFFPRRFEKKTFTRHVKCSSWQFTNSQN